MSERKCRVRDCERPYLCRGFCKLHYDRVRVKGSPDDPRRPTLEERFWSKVDRSGGPDACWPWLAYRMASGHGLFGRSGRGTGMALAHRTAWELTIGAIPDGLFALHCCDNGWCCNPRHLFLGTQADNLADMRAKGRGNAPRGERHPKHKLTEDQVRAIRRSPESNTTLSERYGVHPMSIRCIRIRRNWAWLA